jgi:hypothetical protein
MRQAFTPRRLGRLAAIVLVAGLSHVVTRFAAEYLWFRTSDLYGEAMFIVRSSSDVDQQVGAPIVTGWPVVERYVSSKVGEVTARVPIHGPRGEATLQLRAKNRGGSWEFQQLETQVARGRTIDLMPHPWRPQKLALRGSGRLYFVGIGPLSRLDVGELARSYSERYQVDITVLPPLPYAERSQWAKEMIRVLKAGFPALVADPQAVISAVTEIGMEWYSWRDDERFAVVSASGLSPDRFRRQLSKCLGLLWFELPMSADSRSILYDTVESVVDLDLMSGDF